VIVVLWTEPLSDSLEVHYRSRMPRRAGAVDLPLALGPEGGSLPSRVTDAIIAAIHDGLLAPGDALPSTRALAARLAVSRGPVVAAFDELAAAGFIVSRQGSGTVIAAGADDAARAGAASHVTERSIEHPSPPTTSHRAARWDLRPGRPDTSLIDGVAWRRAWRHAAAAPPGNDADHAPRHGELRVALAAHLRRHRGLLVEPDDLLFAPGVGALLHALPAAIGHGPWAMEDPGYAEAWTALTGAGAQVQPVPVDDEGLDPALLPRSTRTVYVTPAHQYPLGARMPVARRAALVEWAERVDGLIVEDDYDGEFRYDVAPMPALRSLVGGGPRVVYIGTASKLWAPTLRVAWIIAPTHLRAPLDLELERRGLHVPEMTGRALAHLLDGGAWIAHHARCARTYAARRAALVAALRRYLPGVDLAGIDAGLHLVLRLPDSTDDHDLVTTLDGAGILANPLTAYGIESTQPGLVLCYATLPETQADACARAMAPILRAAGAA